MSTLQLHVPYPLCLLSQMTLNNAVHKNVKVSDASKRCQACKLPVVYNPYFCCYKGCEFFLHASCANLPRKKRSMLHKHPLELDRKSTIRTQFHAKHFCCSACGQFHDGFKYSCCDFNLDVGSASITLPFKTSIHDHLLTIKSNDLQVCSVCKLRTSSLFCLVVHVVSIWGLIALSSKTQV